MVFGVCPSSSPPIVPRTHQLAATDFLSTKPQMNQENSGWTAWRLRRATTKEHDKPQVKLKTVLDRIGP